MSSHSDDAGLDLFEGVDEKSMAGADFTAEIIGELRRALATVQEATGLTQKEIADRLGVSKSGVHRWLYGDGNMTLRKLGELVWAMGCRPSVRIRAELDGCALEEATMLQPASAMPILADPDSLRSWFRLEPLGYEEARRIQAALKPSAPQARFISRNGAGFLQQCLMPHGKQAVGYFERCLSNDMSPPKLAAVASAKMERRSLITIAGKSTPSTEGPLAATCEKIAAGALA